MTSVSLKFRLRSFAYVTTILLSLPFISLAADDASMPDSPKNSLSEHQLVDALRAGGYIIYFRHGITDHSTYDTDRNNLENCAAQRLLSEEGRKEMRDIGAAIRTLGIQVSSVFSSPYCRCIDTVRLAFGDDVKVVNDLRHTVNADEATARQRASVLKSMLGTAPLEAGTNTVIAGHTANLQEAAGIWPKPEGVAIIFKPGPRGTFTYIATVTPTQWQELVRIDSASGGNKK